RLERYRAPTPLGRPSSPRDAGDFIGRARKACGISFREASSRTRSIARELGNRRYYCSAGALSDYETRKFSPRHIHKLISICAVYFERAVDLFEAYGVSLDKAGNRAMPSKFLRIPESKRIQSPRPFRFLREMEQRFGPLPWFLRRACSPLFGLPSV